MDRMLNQRWISLEQEFEWKCAENLKACRADFHAKIDAALARYKQGREALERQVRDLEVDLKGAHEVRWGTERALAEADATIDTLRRDVSRLEEENAAMVLQIVELSRGLQEARDSEAEARMLRRQRMQMFRGFSARLMEAAHLLGIDGLNLPTIPEDDGSILHLQGRQAGGRFGQGRGAHRHQVLGAPGTCRDADLLQHPAPSPRP
jgi:hypothetical protein